MKNKNSKIYMAYGSNINLQQMSKRCPTAEVLGYAEVKDYKMLFRGSPYSAVATIEPEKGSTVPVLLWEIKSQDEKALDRYEGYPFFYHKEKLSLELDGETIEPMVYIMNEGHEIGMPSDQYLKTILDGYKQTGYDFDMTAIDKTVYTSLQHVNELQMKNEKNKEFGKKKLNETEHEAEKLKKNSLDDNYIKIESPALKEHIKQMQDVYNYIVSQIDPKKESIDVDLDFIDLKYDCNIEFNDITLNLMEVMLLERTDVTDLHFDFEKGKITLFPDDVEPFFCESKNEMVLMNKGIEDTDCYIEKLTDPKPTEQEQRFDMQ